MVAATRQYFDELCGRFASVLAQTEWAPRQQLRAYQEGLLARLVSFAFTHSPFYRERLAPLFRNGAKPDPSCWADVPILTRAELAQEIGRISPSVVPEDLGPSSEMRTSGTTGASIVVRNSYLGRVAAESMMQRLYRWNDFDLTAPLASVRTYSSGRRRYPDGVTEMRWSYPGPPAPHFTIEAQTPVADLIEWLARRRPTYLLTFPSIAHEIAVHPDAERIAELGLKHILAISEIVLPETRAVVSARLGCPIAQFYACAEIGCIAVQSPVDESCLVCDEAVLVEIVDEEGDAVAPGQTGRVVLTGLYNYATPFIRYAIGDYATTAREPCASGRTLSRLQRIEGRARNALRTASGARIWPSAVVSPSFLACIPPVPFQLRQPGEDRIELLIAEGAGEQKAPDYAGLRTYLSALLECPVQLEIKTIDHLPRSAAGKFEPVISAL